MAEVKKSTTKVIKKKTENIDTRKQEMLRRGQRYSQRGRKERKPYKEKKEFDVRLVSIRRVSKVRKGGKRMRLSVMAVIGDGKGSVGVAVAKGKDVKSAEGKAINKARKKMFKVPLKGQTIPHEVTVKYGAAKIILKPASPGTGVIAGGAIRAVVELAGIKDILSKVLGTKNTISNVYATSEAFSKLRLTRFENDETS